MLSGAGATAMLNARVTEAESASTTLTVKFALPAAVGVPLICAPERLNPDGRVPAEISQLYGALPPLAWRACEEAAPTCPPGKLLVAMVRAGAIAKLSTCVSFS